MDELSQKLARLSSAEDFLEFFGIRYEAAVVDVNRLHILKRFQQYIRQIEDLDRLGEVAMFSRYRQLLAQAYDDFVHSNALQERVFKVFRDVRGEQSVSLQSLQQNLAERRAARARAPVAATRATAIH